MREIRLVGPELWLIAATRGLLGIGIGLLLSEKLRHARHRRTLGRTLAAIGLLSTVPLGLRVFRRERRRSMSAESGEAPMMGAHEMPQTERATAFQ